MEATGLWLAARAIACWPRSWSLWVFVVLPGGYLAAAELRGFDDTFCRAHQTCSWRYV